MYDTYSDKDIAMELLMTEKAVSERYHWSTLEAADPQLRQTLERIHNDINNMAKQVFDFARQQGWYTPATADPQTLNAFRQVVTSVRNEVERIAHPQAGIGQAGYQARPTPTYQGPQYGYTPPAGPQQTYGQVGQQFGQSPQAGQYS